MSFMKQPQLGRNFYCLCAAIIAICQLVQQTSAITGGQPATENQFPYQVAMKRFGASTCGGSIISKDFILTAAHCVAGYTKDGELFVRKPSEITVEVGTYQREQKADPVKIAKIIVHELYKFNMNDIALLELEKPLTFSSAIQAIPLSSSTPPEGSSVIVSGWGRLSNKGGWADYLQWTTVSTISDKQCERRIQISSERLICMDHKPGTGVCVGDSGGPAAFNGKLVGVASVIIKECGSEKPDVYTNIAFFLPWIKKNARIY